ncbi:hypothetical protein ASALC70_01435 [Alcanivorax sp. ALC70]|nr:hypothetical protein ASALC70_01435 [Alcanivorax sp. ALC70]
MKTRIDSVDDVTQSFARQGYICDQRTALAVYLAAQLHKPVLVEGPRGSARPSWPRPPPASWKRR